MQIVKKYKFDDSITNFEQHQKNDSEPILSGTTILSWTIGKTAKLPK